MCPTKPKIFLLYGPAQSKFANLQPKPHSWQMSCDLLPKAFLTNRSTDVTILQLQKLKLSRPMVGRLDKSNTNLPLFQFIVK